MTTGHDLVGSCVFRLGYHQHLLDKFYHLLQYLYQLLTSIIFIVVVILAINGYLFTLCLDPIVMEVEVKVIDGLWAR